MFGVLMTLPSFAFEYTYEGQTLSYTVLDEGSKTVSVKGKNNSGDLVIPDIAKDGSKEYTVTEIGASAFSGCSDLTSVIIPGSVTEIGARAFRNCSGLTSVIIPGSVTSIGKDAFINCTGLVRSAYPNTINSPFSNGFAVGYNPDGAIIEDGWIFGPEKSAILFAPLTLEGEYIIPNTVTEIGYEAFFYCSGLTSVIIPGSVTEIGDYAFSGCSHLVKSAYPSVFYNPFSNGIAVAYNPDGAIIEDGWIFGPEKTSIVFAPYTFEGEYVIPNSVKEIGGAAFSGCSGLTSVTIPNLVTSIGVSAFINCTGLTSLTIPNSVKAIGDYAFNGCTGLTSVIIPNLVTEMGDKAFSGCTGLVKSAYPNTLDNPFDNPFSKGIAVAYNPDGAIIEDGWIFGPEKNSILFAPLTFEGEYVIPGSVTEIGDYAFWNCRGLTSVTIPNSVTSIGKYAFDGCSSLTSVTIPNLVEKIGEYTFDGCSGLTSVIIPNSVKTIGGSAFYGCSALTSVIIPGSVTWIGKSAFDNCTGLVKSAYPNTLDNPFPYTTVAIAYNPDGAIVEDGWVFGSEKNSILFAPYTLEGEYVIPESVTAIGEAAFKGCNALTSVIMPGSVTSIGDNAFNGCTGLVKSAYPNTFNESPYPYSNGIAVAYNPDGAIVEDGWVFGPEKSAIRFAPYTLEGEYVIPNTVKEIGSSAFHGCSGLTSVTIPNSVDTIGGAAFSDCTALTSVTIPDSVTSIVDYTFSDCTALTSVTIPGSVTEIGGSAFRGCSALTSVTIPESVEKIGDKAFSGCTGLTSVNVNWATPIFLFTETFDSSIYSKAVLNIPADAIMAYISTDWWTTFENHAAGGFAMKNYNDGVFNYALVNDPDDQHAILVRGDYSSMTTVNIPESITVLSEDEAPVSYNVTVIAPEAFYLFDVTEVTIPNSVKTIGDWAFLHCGRLTSVSIGNSVETIGYAAFDWCSRLTEVTIPNSVKTIGAEAFNLCTGLTRAEFASVESLCSIEFNGFNSNPLQYAHNLYIAGEEVKDLVIPNTVKKIGASAFECCSGLTSVTIPNSVKTIGGAAFYECTGLTEMTIPNSVKTIGGAAFYGCTGLKSVTIPGSVTEIGEDAFNGCTGLVKSAYPNTLDNPFSNGIAIAYDPNDGIIEDGLIFGPEKNSILFAPLTFEGEYVIPNSVETIGEAAFKGCNALTSVTIGNSVTSIGNEAFYGCSALTEVIIPGSVTEIGEDAFYGCSSLTEVTIPGSVTSIGSRAFYSCSDLRSVSLLYGDKIKFGYNVFSKTNIRTAYVDRPIANDVIPVDILETLTIGNTVTEISALAWSNARNLRTLTLGSSLVSIGESAFRYTALSQVVIPPSVETIGSMAFRKSGLSNYLAITMGHNVKSIGHGAFGGAIFPTYNIEITAQTPPTVQAPATPPTDEYEEDALSISDSSTRLYLQGQKAVDAYRNAYIWDRCNEYHVMVEPTEMKYEGEQKLNGKPGDTFQLKATLMPENVTLPEVFWRSTNPDIATVDQNGLVTLHADLDDVMYAVSESGDAGCKIIAESLYADGPVVEFDVTVAQNGVDDILVDSPADESAIDYASSYDVYNLSGVWVGDSLEGLAHGFYVVRQGGIAKKVAVK